MEININASNLFTDNDQKKRANNALRELIVELSNNLNIETLSEIIIPEDFSIELLSFQEEHDLRERGHTDNQFGTAMGKTLSYMEESEIKQVIFFDKNLFYSLFLDDEYNKSLSIHLLHHELCHVHDYGQRTFTIDEETFQPPLDNLTEILTAHAEVIWSEYIACRLSVATIFNGFLLNVDFLIELIDEIRIGTQNLIDRYRYHGDIENLFKQSQKDISLLLKISGGVIGYLHSLNSSELESSVSHKIAETYFNDVWLSLGKELQGLYVQYPDWNGLEQYCSLSSVVLSCFNKLGIYPKMTSHGLYVSVP